MEVVILGVYLEIFFFRITWSKIRVPIITGAHYTRVNTVWGSAPLLSDYLPVLQSWRSSH